MNYGEGKKSLIPTGTIYTALRKVDVSDFEQMFDHPMVLQLMEKSQLSFADRVFPGGRHSRYEHTVFIYHFTYELTEQLLKKGCISKQQATDLRLASIPHDIGHSPFSHTIGNVLGYMINPEKPKTHNDKARELLNSEEKDSSGKTIKDLISQYGGNFKKVVSIVTKEAPESCVLSHHTLGTDKMGYVLVDSHHTGYRLNPPFFLDMFPSIFYYDGEIGISNDEDSIAQVKGLQNMIQDMYINVYFNGKVKQFSRFVEKAVEMDINLGKFTPDQVWNMSEGALIHLLETSENEDVTKLLRKYSRNELFEPVMEFKIDKKSLENTNGVNGKNRIVSVSKDVSDALIRRYSNPLNLTIVERKISEEVDIPFVNVLATLSADPKRIMPEDTALYNPYGEKVGMLYELNPDHYKSLVEKAESFFALRINVSDFFTKMALKESEAIRQIVEDDIKGI